ncbi:amino acid transporter, partial [Aureobasidium melanogenum]
MLLHTFVFRQGIKVESGPESGHILCDNDPNNHHFPADYKPQHRLSFPYLFDPNPYHVLGGHRNSKEAIPSNRAHISSVTLVNGHDTVAALRVPAYRLTWLIKIRCWAFSVLSSSGNRSIMSSTPSLQEKGLHIGSQPGEPDKLEGITEDFEVFKQTEDGVNFRTVGWPMATVIFLKIIFALGVLSIPAAMYTLGAVGGSLSVIGWQALNTYTAVLQGDFRNNHPRCHSIADMAGVVGGKVMKELTGALFIVAYVILTGSGIVGVSIGINALSHHGACTVWWAVLATFFVALAASA